MILGLFLSEPRWFVMFDCSFSKAMFGSLKIWGKIQGKENKKIKEK